MPTLFMFPSCTLWCSGTSSKEPCGCLGVFGYLMLLDIYCDLGRTLGRYHLTVLTLHLMTLNALLQSVYIISCT